MQGLDMSQWLAGNVRWVTGERNSRTSLSGFTTAIQRHCPEGPLLVFQYEPKNSIASSSHARQSSMLLREIEILVPVIVIILGTGA